MPNSSAVTPDFLAGLYRAMYAMRVFENRIIELYRDGSGLVRGYFHPYLGQEAIAAGVSAALRPDDIVFSNHRGHGHVIARGGDLGRMTAEILGRRTGYCGGLGGSMNITDPDGRFVTASSGIVGGGIPVGTGAGLGVWVSGGDRVTVVYASDGAVNNGVFCEALNLAALWNLPVLYVIENNQYAVSTPVEKSTRETELHRRGDAFRIDHERVDGNDVLAVFDAATAAVDRCRRGEGPFILEALTFRQCGHHVNDPGAYLPPDLCAYWQGRDPLDHARKLLGERGGMNEASIVSIENGVREEMERAVTFAIESPEMDIAEFLAFTGGDDA